MINTKDVCLQLWKAQILVKSVWQMMSHRLPVLHRANTFHKIVWFRRGHTEVGHFNPDKKFLYALKQINRAIRCWSLNSSGGYLFKLSCPVNKEVKSEIEIQQMWALGTKYKRIWSQTVINATKSHIASAPAPMILRHKTKQIQEKSQDI